MKECFGDRGVFGDVQISLSFVVEEEKACNQSTQSVINLVRTISILKGVNCSQAQKYGSWALNFEFSTRSILPFSLLV